MQLSVDTIQHFLKKAADEELPKRQSEELLA
jgi:hypothetical protein